MWSASLLRWDCKGGAVMLHEIELNGYEAALVGERYLMFGTRGSYGIEQLHITAGEAWDGLDITATFCPPGEEPVRVLLGRDNCINVPPEATAKATHTVSGHIVFTGVSSGVRRISHDLTYRVADHSGTEDGEGGATPSIIDQILAETKADRVAAAESASAADKSAVDAAASAKAADDAANAALTAKRETEQAAADALQSIAEAETSAVQAVENTGREQSEAVAAAGDTQIGRVSAASDTALAEVTAEGNKQIGLIGDTAAGALDDIKSAKDGALTEIFAEGQTQKSTVAAEGVAQLEAIARAATAELGRWAPRIEDTVGPAPVVQTDIAAARWPLYPTFHIDTVQAGEGDPSPENIRPISGRDAVEATLCGRNLGNFRLLTNQAVYVHNFSTYVAVGYYATEKPVIVHENVTYRLSSAGVSYFAGNLHFKNKKGKTISQLFEFNSFTVPNGTYYIMFSLASNTITNPDAPIMLNLGNTALPYEPYQGSSTQLPLPKTCYGGKVEWRHNSEFDKCIVLDGTENWRKRTDISITGGSCFYPNNFVNDAISNAPVVASAYFVGRVSPTINLWDMRQVGTDVGIQFNAPFAEVSDFTAWLAEHPLTVYYQSTAYDGTNGLDVCLTEYQTGFVELDGTEDVKFEIYGDTQKRIRFDLDSKAIARYELKFSHGNPGDVPTVTGSLSASFNRDMLNRLQIITRTDTWTALGVTDTATAKTWLAAQKAAGTPVQVAYQLAAPEVYALPAAPQFAALHDTNTLYCDTGDTEIMFAADTKKYIDSKIETLSTAIAALGTT